MKATQARLAFLGILALFVIPLALAWLMYSGTIEYRPGATDNHGQLVEPPVPVDWSQASRSPGDTARASLAGVWVALYPLEQPCTERCLERVYQLRQVHRAAGRHADRIRIAVLNAAPTEGSMRQKLEAIDDELVLLEQPETAFMSAIERAGSDAIEPSVYLVDPLGNIMMTYEVNDSMSLLSKDLKKLLTWSKMDESS
ncbi:hypothetical protein [Elongatibacter sediminis]|uniref:Thioredoxin domain-containing protein n=1 Tax=Elongatibacter sediminis TaxID=3119006 RepID=A0AAW9R884_9GAMM